MKKAVIVGCNGQDGRLLYDFLQRRNYELLGIARTYVRGSKQGWDAPIDISNTESIFQVINIFRPDEIYYLAAIHRSSEDEPAENMDLIRESYAVHVLSLVNFLEAIRKHSSKTRLFYAASSEIFGESTSEMQDERTPINPNCIYGITKAAGVFTCRSYRDRYSIFASGGILYNHESALRSEKFVSKKIIKGAINVKNGKQEKLILGNLGSEVDWGYAPDYIEAMHRLLNIQVSDDFIIATGKRHKVRDFVKIAFEYLGLDWIKHVEEDRTIIKKKNGCNIGNPKKLMSMAGWKPTVEFKEMIRILIEKEGGFDCV
jgi:GDPmannose 4,6-dehydratase